MSEIRKLTRLGGDVRKIAALLQSKGRGRDTILAHITPQEAALLKSRGGRGSTNPETGLLEFQPDEGDIGSYEPIQTQDVEVPAGGDVPMQPPVAQSFPVSPGGAAPTFGPAVEETPIPAEFQTTPGQALARLQAAPEEPLPTPPEQTIPQPPEVKVPEVTGPTPMERIKAAGKETSEFLDKNQALVRALGGLGFGLRGAALERRGRGEAEALRAEMAKLGEPYRAQAQQLGTGQLTPVQQQQINALRAQLAQQQAGRGGVGAAQAQEAINRVIQQYTQQNIDQAMKLTNIADQYQMQAIKSGYAASKDAQDAANRFYSAIGQFLVPTKQG